jgi:pyrroloquinoline quinone (PQQ) biosynthesis protein C
VNLAYLLQRYPVVVNWPRYNKSLVRRGKVVLDFDVIENWDNKLDKMNYGKEGMHHTEISRFLCSIARIY